jgi:adenylate kinase
MDKNILVILGPAGSGKSTQSDLIAKNYNYKKITISSVLKEEVQKKTKLGKELNSTMLQGELVPYKISCDLLFKKIKKTRFKNILIDGFPRQIEQAIVFDYFLYTYKYNLKNVIYIDVPRRECVKRLIIRKRKDDTKIAINKRLYIYVKETKKVLSKYRSEKLLLHVNGYDQINNVFSEIKKKIKI